MINNNPYNSYNPYNQNKAPIPSNYSPNRVPQYIIPGQSNIPSRVQTPPIQRTQIPAQQHFQQPQEHVKLQHNETEGSDDEYEALHIPPNFEEAKKHAQSRQTGHAQTMHAHEKEFCKCCGYQVQRHEMNFFEHEPNDLKFLGSGFPLFYNFIKYCMIILILFICISGIYNLYTNYLGQFCNHVDILSQDSFQGVKQDINIEEEMQKCHKNFAHIFSIVNKKNVIGEDGQPITDTQKYLDVQHILNAVVAGVVMIVLMIFRRSQRILDAEIDEVQCTPSDFTVIVKNIPKGLDCDYEKELRHIFTNNVVRNEQGLSVPMDVTKVNLVYDIDHIIELEEQLKEVVAKKQEFLKENGFRDVAHGYQQDDPVLKDWDEEIEHIEHRIHKIENNVTGDQAHYFTGTAFISFKTEQQKDLVVEQNTFTFMETVKSYMNNGELKDITNDDLTWENNKLFVEEAPEPDDIDWEFIHYKTKTKILARIKAWFITIAFLIGCFIVIKLLTVYQGHIIEQTYEEFAQGKVTEYNWYMVKLVTFSISMSIVLFNKFVLGKVFHIIVDNEYYSTKTKFNIAFALKLTVGLFVNSALLAYFVEILGEKNFYGPGGFIYTETWVFIWNCIVPPTVWLIDPWTIQKNGWRKKALEDAKKGQCYLTQDEANKIMEQVEYTQGKRYADIMKTMWFTFFYAPAIPLGLLFSLLNLVYYYFIDQYNVMKRRTIKETLSCFVSIEQIENLEMTIIFYAIGNITFSWMLFDNIDPLGWWLLGIAIIYSNLPMQEINEYLFPIDKKPEELTYQEAELVFETDYDRLNPITKKAALKRLKKLIKEDHQKQHQKHLLQGQQPIVQSVYQPQIQNQVPIRMSQPNSFAAQSNYRQPQQQQQQMFSQPQGFRPSYY